MSRRFDALTVALTGQLSFILIVSTVLALVASFLLLLLYRRAVVKSMRRRSRSEILEPKGFLPPESEHKPNDAPLNFSFVTCAAARANLDATTLYRSANRRRWLIAHRCGLLFRGGDDRGVFVGWKIRLLPFPFHVSYMGQCLAGPDGH